MKLLLTRAFNYSQDQIQHLKKLGHEIIFVQDERLKLDIDVSKIEGVICNALFLYNDIKRFSSLRYIQLTSAGLDRVPLDYISENGIKIYNARGVYSAPMAEFAICGILELYKQSYKFFANQQNRIWEKNRNLLELNNKRVVIIGAGSIGTEIAKRLKPFDTEIIGIDINACKKEYYDDVCPLDSTDTLLESADVVILSLPLTKETLGFFDMSKFELMKESAVFVNISRGKLVNQRDLIDALSNKKIFGAVLDVFEEEPLSKESKLWELDNVIITPHNSFVGENNNQRMFETICENLESLINYE